MRWLILMAIAALGLAAPAQALDCNREPAFSARPYAGSPALARCLRDGPAADAFEVFYPESWGARPSPSDRLKIDAARRAVADALEVYRARGYLLGPPFPITIGLSRDLGEEGAPDAHRNGDRCVIRYFGVNGRDLTGIDIAFTVAHEVFHCVQAFEVVDRIEEHQKWWAEGSAEFAANIVYPAANLEFPSTSAYGQSSVLFTHSYSAALFFQAYANRNGHGGVRNLLALLGPARATEDYYPTMASVAGFAESWHAFATGFLDRRIGDPGGGQMAQANPELVELRIPSEGGSFDFSVEPFTLGGVELVLPEDGSFVIEGLKGDHEHDVSWSRERGAWTRTRASDPPLTIETRCEDERRIRVAITSTVPRPGPVTRTFRVTTGDGGDGGLRSASDDARCRPRGCNCVAHVPACAVGSFTIDDPTVFDPYWTHVAGIMSGGIPIAAGSADLPPEATPSDIARAERELAERGIASGAIDRAEYERMMGAAPGITGGTGLAREMLDAARAGGDAGGGSGGACTLDGQTGNAKLTIARDGYFTSTQSNATSGSCAERDGATTFSASYRMNGSGHVCRSGPATLCFLTEGAAGVTMTITPAGGEPVSGGFEPVLYGVDTPYACTPAGLTLTPTLPLSPGLPLPLPFQRE